MKFRIILLILAWAVAGDGFEDVKCKDGGCFEVIKTFAEFLEKKIDATEALLNEAQNELNDITFGNDEAFKKNIEQVDEKLTKLLNDINTPIEAGDKTLMEMINGVFDEVGQIRNLATEIENEAENTLRGVETIEINQENIQETIREIQAEMNRLMNATTDEGPQAFQDAYDRSEKFDLNENELKDVLEQAKVLLRDYEANLLNAKKLTGIAIEKFAEISKQADDALAAQGIVEEEVKDGKLKVESQLMASELENLRKLARKSLDEANKVYEEAFDLLNEVSKLELNHKLDEITAKVEELNKHSAVTDKSLLKFAAENAEFLDRMEKTIEAAEVAEERAFELQRKIDALLEVIEGIHADALKAISDKDSIVENARNIHNSLEDFTLKVEKTREDARMALEQIPKIMKKIEDSVNIVDKLEQKLDSQTKAATDAKEKCSTAKEQMDEVLKESDEIKAKIEQLEKDFEKLPESIGSTDKESMKISDEIDKLEKIEADDSKLIESTKVKIDTTKAQTGETDEKVDEALKLIQGLIDKISNLKNIDEKSLNEFEENLIEAEKELDESQLNQNLHNLRAARHYQNELMEQYRLDLAALEYQLSVIKKNAESLNNRCYKRTRLEP